MKKYSELIILISQDTIYVVVIVFKDFIISLHFGRNESTNCLLSNDNVEIIEATGAWLGQQYTPDQQCQMSHGPDSVMCKVTTGHLY